VAQEEAAQQDIVFAVWSVPWLYEGVSIISGTGAAICTIVVVA
jgi:hypothetical protein